MRTSTNKISETEKILFTHILYIIFCAYLPLVKLFFFFFFLFFMYRKKEFLIKFFLIIQYLEVERFDFRMSILQT